MGYGPRVRPEERERSDEELAEGSDATETVAVLQAEVWLEVYAVASTWPCSKRPRRRCLGA